VIVPKCSIIIPAYKCEAYIVDCVQSALAQTVREIEVLIVDDCSPDGTGEIVQAMTEVDARLRYLKQPKNEGVAAARNRGVREAKGEWIAFLDSDDAWEPTKLEAQFALQEETDADLVYTAARCMGDDGMLSDRYFLVPPKIDLNCLLKGNDIICSSVLIRRDWMCRFPMERSDLHEDFLCWARMLQAGCKAVGVTAALTRYRLAEGSKSRNKFKSACMTWATYRQIGIPIHKRLIFFAAYIVHGLKRYFA